MGAGVLPLFSYVFFFWLLYLIRLAHEKRMLGHITLLHCQCLSPAESFRVARLLFPLTGYCWRIQRAASPQPSPLRGEGADGESSPAVSYRMETAKKPNIDKQPLIPVELDITANLSLFLAV